METQINKLHKISKNEANFIKLYFKRLSLIYFMDFILFLICTIILIITISKINTIYAIKILSVGFFSIISLIYLTFYLLHLYIYININENKYLLNLKSYFKKHILKRFIEIDNKLIIIPYHIKQGYLYNKNQISILIYPLDLPYLNIYFAVDIDKRFSIDYLDKFGLPNKWWLYYLIFLIYFLMVLLNYNDIKIDEFKKKYIFNDTPITKIISTIDSDAVVIDKTKKLINLDKNFPVKINLKNFLLIENNTMNENNYPYYYLFDYSDENIKKIKTSYNTVIERIILLHRLYNSYYHYKTDSSWDELKILMNNLHVIEFKNKILEVEKIIKQHNDATEDETKKINIMQRLIIKMKLRNDYFPDIIKWEEDYIKNILKNSYSLFTENTPCININEKLENAITPEYISQLKLDELLESELKEEIMNTLVFPKINPVNLEVVFISKFKIIDEITGLTVNQFIISMKTDKIKNIIPMQIRIVNKINQEIRKKVNNKSFFNILIILLIIPGLYIFIYNILLSKIFDFVAIIKNTKINLKEAKKDNTIGTLTLYENSDGKLSVTDDKSGRLSKN